MGPVGPNLRQRGLSLDFKAWWSNQTVRGNEL